MTRVSSANSRSTILIVSTCWWAFPARLAMAFAAIGHRVEAICPAHHPLRKTRAVSASHNYSAMKPLEALAKAIGKADPGLVIPCDDRAVSHLHALHRQAQSDAPAIAQVIERSLGNTDSFATVDRRSALIAAARAEGISAPEMMPVETAGQLRNALNAVGLPAVLKSDGTWGGLGVAVARSGDEAASLMRTLSSPVSAIKALKRLLVDRDPYSLKPWLARTQPVVNVQRYISGTPANSALACWKGEVLSAICVTAVRTRGPCGASTVVKIVDNRQMLDASTKLVKRLGLSGFCGFDFLLDDTDRTAHLIEMNARSTPISYLPLGDGRNLVAALAKQLDGVPAIQTTPPLAQDVIAFFPQAWLLEPHSELLNSSFHDVPWGEDELVRELMRLPWPERGFLARLLRRLRGSAHSTAVAAVPVHYTSPAAADLSARS